MGLLAAAAHLKNSSQSQRKQKEQEKTNQKIIEPPSHYPTSRDESILPDVKEIKVKCHQEEIQTKRPVSTSSPPQHVQDIQTKYNDDKGRHVGNKLSNGVRNHADENRNSDVKVGNGNIKMSNGLDNIMNGHGDVGNGEITMKCDNKIMNGKLNMENEENRNNNKVTAEPSTAKTAVSKKEIPQIIVEPFIEPVKELYIEPVNEPLRESVKESVRILPKNKLEDHKMQTSTEDEVEEPEYITKIKTFKITKWPKFNTADIVQYGPESLLEVLHVVQLQVGQKETKKYFIFRTFILCPEIGGVQTGH